MTRSSTPDRTKSFASILHPNIAMMRARLLDEATAAGMSARSIEYLLSVLDEIDTLELNRRENDAVAELMDVVFSLGKALGSVEGGRR